MTRLVVLAALVLSLGVGPVSSAHAQEADSATVSPDALSDSTTAALSRFNAASPPSPADTARLRDWASRLRQAGDSLTPRSPDRARSLLSTALRAVRTLGDSARIALYARDVGTTYYYQSRFDDALRYWRESLALHRSIGDLQGVSATLNNIAIIHARQNRYEEALKRYRQSLAIARERENADGVASALNNIGLLYENQGRYREALDEYQQSLAIEQEQGNEEGIAASLTNVGNVYESLGAYDRAIDHHRRSLALYRRLGNRQGVATALNNLGIALKNQGRYDRALERYREALTIQRELGERSGVASALANTGTLQLRQGRLDVALERFREAVAIERELGDTGGVAMNLTSIADVRVRQGRYDDALSQYRDALELFRDAGNRTGIATALRNVGDVYRRQGRYDDALASLREALALHRELSERPSAARTLTVIGQVLDAQDRPDAALSHYNDALRIFEEIGERPGIAESLSLIGDHHLRRGELAAATDALERAVHQAETLRRDATSAEARRSLLATQIDAYRALTTAHVRAGRPEQALTSLERSRARLLAEQLTPAQRPADAFGVPPVDSLQHALDDDAAAVLYANTETTRPVIALVVSRDTVAARELPNRRLLETVGEAYPRQLSDLRTRSGSTFRASGLSVETPPASAPRTGTPTVAQTVRLYRSLLTESAGDDLLAWAWQQSEDGPSQAQVPAEELARGLYDLLVAPLDSLLDPYREVVFVPSGSISYLPLETLRSGNGRYLVEDVAVRYAPSLTVLRRLQTRRHPHRSHHLLAFGGALYGSAPAPSSPPPPAPDSLVLAAASGDERTGNDERTAGPDSLRVRSADHVGRLLHYASRRLRRGLSPRSAYDELGYHRWPELPDTKAEAAHIGRIGGPGSTVLLGRDVTERRLRQMSATGRLDNYRRVHFATHGVAVAEAPDLSALVLSQIGASDSLAERDGFLTMPEISDLELAADVTVLSACRSGLGPVVAGEGVVGLSHAFLRAGSNATLVSQWAVLDRSTRQFMTAVYRAAEQPGTSFADAVTAVKRAFIAGDHGPLNQHPYRWAPFVYYGRK